MLNDLLCFFKIKLYKLEVDFKNGSKLQTWVKGRSYKGAIKRFYSLLPMRLLYISGNDPRGFFVESIKLVDWKLKT